MASFVFILEGFTNGDRGGSGWDASLLCFIPLRCAPKSNILDTTPTSALQSVLPTATLGPAVA